MDYAGGMPATLTLTLDDDLVRRLDRLANATGLERAAALEHALRQALDLDEQARAAQEVMLAAVAEGDQGSRPGHSALHEDIRLWLLGWGSEDERKRPRSC